MRQWKGYTWALCALFLLLRPVTSNVLPQDATDKPAVLQPIFNRDAAPAIRNPVPMEEVLGSSTTPSTTTTAPMTTTTLPPPTTAAPTELPRTTAAPSKMTTTNRYRASRIELKAKNATADNPATTTTTTSRPEPKIQMKRPSQLQGAAAKPMGLKETLIQITDQLRQQQAIKSQTVQTAKVEVAKKPSAKSNQEEIIIYETSGHDGVAMPLTMEDIEREMAQVEFQLQESTPKEGISTWILLSGTETTPQPNSNTGKGPVYYVESDTEMESEKKVDKIMKVKDDKEKPVVLPKRRPSTTPSPAAKPKPKRTTTATTTTTTTTTTEAPLTEAPKPAIKKVRPESRVNVKRPRRPTTTTTTTTTEEPEPVEEEEITEEPVEDSPESSTFLILEAKESEFDLPADRSPIQGKKKSNVTPKPKKTKKKPDVKDKKKPGLEDMLEEIVSGVTGANKKPGKTPVKKVDKPVTTQIMNYLSREVMPTVGVGLVGLVAAAGIATYFLGNTFTPLRRSDRTDEIYYNNNEEYAGPDGQYEEEWFSKVIAGSPTYRNNLREAYKPSPAPAPAPGVIQQQANYAAYKYPQYSKFARPPPPPQYNPNRNYNVRPNYGPQGYRPNPAQMSAGVNPSELVRKHSMAMPYNYPHHHYHPHAIAPQPPAPPMAPVREPETKNYFSEASKRHSFSASGAEIQAEAQPKADEPEEAVGPIEDSDFLKRTSQSKTNQFVVGSVYPEALTANEPLGQQSESVPEHGPRRRRRRGANQVHKKKTKKLDDNELDNEHELPVDLEPAGSTEVNTDKSQETSSHQDHVTSSTVISSTESNEGLDKSETSTSHYYETVSVVSYNNAFGDFFRRMFQLKLKLGVSFLRGMADGVARYLHQFEERLYRSTNYHTR